MKRNIFTIFILFIFLSVFTNTTQCADIDWYANGQPSTIPDDGNTWYLDRMCQTPSSFTINGVFEVRGTNGELRNGNTINISGNTWYLGTLTVNGTLEIGYNK